MTAYDDVYRFALSKEWRDGAGNRQTYGVFFRAQPGAALERIVDGQGIAATVAAPEAGTFHHVVGVYDGSRLFLYVDGVLLGNAPDARTALDKTAPLLIGAQTTDLYGGYRGVVDEIAIYDRVLPAARIAAHFEAGRR